MVIFKVFSLLGGLAMFLYGMNVMGDGLKKLGGGKFENILGRLTSSPVRGVLLGALVTAVIQSSSATTVMVVGFVNSGIMQLSQAVGIIMGANVGTTITSWILSLSGIEGDSFWINLVKPVNFTPVLAFIGIIISMAAKSEKKKNLGSILIGFAVLMFGMETMSDAVEPLKNVPSFTNILVMFKNPILGVLAGAIMTAIIQSSSASVGILQALCSTGAVTYGAAVPIIMGQNIGTCATALISCIGAGKNAKRTAMVHLYFNVIGTLLFLILFYLLHAIVKFDFINNAAAAVDIAVIHSVFNIFATLVLLPFNKLLEKLAKLTIREGASIDAFAKLDERFLNMPTIAINQSHTLAVNMAYIAKEAYELAVECMVKYDSEKDKKIMENEAMADKYEDALGSYLVRISSKDLTEEESRRVSLYLHAIGDIEQISDYSANILHNARNKNEKDMHFSEKAINEMTVMSDAVNEIMDKLIVAFSGAEPQEVECIAPLESVIDRLKRHLKKAHIRRIREGKCTVDTGFVFTDYITILEKISDHCANIAGAMMDLNENSFDVHHYMGEIVETPEYKRLYSEYSEKYALPVSK
ncbi:MAG: Na/Pi cotransporter family protein [bacterium]|nr:Na/Pi cotransporter family protein [bacterium]